MYEKTKKEDMLFHLCKVERLKKLGAELLEHSYKIKYPDEFCDKKREEMFAIYSACINKGFGYVDDKNKAKITELLNFFCTEVLQRASALRWRNCGVTGSIFEGLSTFDMLTFSDEKSRRLCKMLDDYLKLFEV